jgi:hypothetical protein
MWKPSEASVARPRFGGGFVAGLAPLMGTVLLLGLTMLTVAATRGAADPNAFLVEQQALGMAASVGLGVVAAWYLAASTWMLDRAGRWARAQQRARAAGALLGLTVSALVLALPVVVAIVLPQHPAFGR